MRSFLSFITAAFLLWNAEPSTVSAQGMFVDGDHPMWPDSQEIQDYSGRVHLQGSGNATEYYLDTDQDDTNDLLLVFGPWWYGEDLNLNRPAEGQPVELTGMMIQGMTPPSLIVFELNGQPWRAASEYGAGGWTGDPGWSPQADLVSVSGSVLVDSSYAYHHHFYLDTDGNGQPDYSLGLGPGWYVPSDTDGRPDNGSYIQVSGWLMTGEGLPHLVVQELDGAEWRPSEGPAPWAGGWIHTDSSSSSAYCLTDSSSILQFSWGSSGHMGNSWPDSTFVEFWNVHPDSLPGAPAQNTFMGFYLNMDDPSGVGMMDGPWGRGSGMMSFSQEQTVRLHYSDEELVAHNLSGEGMGVVMWDSITDSWIEVQNATVDPGSNTVTFSVPELSQYYGLSASVATGFAVEDSDLPDDYVLRQNFPNPFNPSTTFEFSVPHPGSVQLTIYDTQGRIVARPVNGFVEAGQNSVRFDASRFSSGVYFYRLSAEGARSVARKFTLLR